MIPMDFHPGCCFVELPLWDASTRIINATWIIEITEEKTGPARAVVKTFNNFAGEELLLSITLGELKMLLANANLYVTLVN